MFLFLVSYLSRLLRTRVEVGWEIVYCCSKVVECALKKDQFFEWAASTELERFSMDLKWERWIGDCSKKTLIAWSLCLRRKPLNLMYYYSYHSGLKIRTTRKQCTVGKKFHQFVSNFQVYLNNICLKSWLFSLVFDNWKIFRFPKTKVVERTWGQLLEWTPMNKWHKNWTFHQLCKTWKSPKSKKTNDFFRNSSPLKKILWLFRFHLNTRLLILSVNVPDILMCLMWI